MKIVDEDTLELIEVEDEEIELTEDEVKQQINSFQEALGCTPEQFYKKYRDYKNAEIEFKKLYDPFREKLLALHKENPNTAKSVIVEGVKLTYVSPSERSSIDTKKLKEELPEVAKEFTKTTTVSATIRLDEI